MEAKAHSELPCLLCGTLHEPETPFEPRPICATCADPGADCEVGLGDLSVPDTLPLAG